MQRDFRVFILISNEGSTSCHKLNKLCSYPNKVGAYTLIQDNKPIKAQVTYISNTVNINSIT